MTKYNSYLRQDPVSGDWILIAPLRGKRPHQLIKKKKRLIHSPKNCPFESLANNELVFALEKENKLTDSDLNWKVAVIKNKYPAFSHYDNKCAIKTIDFPYSLMEGVGHHELIITRWHYKNFPLLSKDDAYLVFYAFQKRYLELQNDSCLSYISIFHNWGPEAGASVYHPHYQLIATPVIPPDISHSLTGSLKFYKKYKKCVHCQMIGFEKKHKKRIIFENKSVIAFVPFVSKEPFEIRIFPKKHLPFFEETKKSNILDIVEALSWVLKKIKLKLKDPDYNFFIHTAPLKSKKNYTHYHWHIEIIPKIDIDGGFELSTGMEINPVDPDTAAKILK